MFTGNKTIEDVLDLEATLRIDAVCNSFEEAWESGTQPKIEAYIEGFTGTQRQGLLSELVALEVQYRHEQGDLASSEEYLRRFPDSLEAIHAAFGRGMSAEALTDRLAECGLLDHSEIASLRSGLAGSAGSQTAEALARQLVSAGKLTEFQADVICTGKPDPLLLGDYRVVNKLGVGGMGVVYEAYHARLGKRVALKVLRRELIADGLILARFEREMKAIGQLNHPNIVCAHDAREDDGIHYLVMELVEGRDFARIVEQQGRLDVAGACEVVRQAALGLQHAHEHKLVHRDVKPSNLMLAPGDHRTESGESGSAIVKVLDLGLARLDQELSQALTTAGQVMGTIDYMAPEQVDNSNEVDIRADIYSLGATLYKLLCGVAPFESREYSTMIMKINALANVDVPPIDRFRTDVPPGLGKVIDRMLAKNPHNRFAAPIEVAAALKPFASGHNIAVLLETTPMAQDTVCEQSVTETKVHLDPVSNDTEPSQPNHSVPHTPTIEPAPAPAAAAKRTWRRDLGIAVGFAMVFAAIMVYRIQTNQGTVIVEIHDKSVAAQLTVDGLEVVDTNDPAKKWTIAFSDTEKESAKKIPAGEYQTTELPGLEFHITDSDGAEYKARTFKLTRGDDIRIRIQPVVRERQATADADRRVAEWVLDLGGRVHLNRGTTVAKSRDELPSEPFILDTVALGDPTKLTKYTELTDDDLEPLSELKQLMSLDLRGTSMTGELLRHHSTDILEHLYVGPKFEEKNLVHVSRFRNLYTVDLALVERSVNDLAPLAQLPGLRVLFLGFGATPDAIAQLSNFNKLEVIGIRGVNILPKDFAHIQKLANLNTLMLDSQQLSVEAIEFLAQMKQLRRLDIYYRQGQFDTSLLTPLTQLRKLYVNGSLDDAGLLRLSALTNLQELDVTHTYTTEAGTKALSEKLPACSIVSRFGTFGPDIANEREVAE